MGYWLKSFNATPPPVPGTTYTVAQINDRKQEFAHCLQLLLLIVLNLPTVPIATTGIFVPVAFAWALLADGPCRGRRWPFIYIGAVINVRIHSVSEIGPVLKS